ncbi:hypothetical protein BGZ94_005849, partial [Podila epigama]
MLPTSPLASSGCMFANNTFEPCNDEEYAAAMHDHINAFITSLASPASPWDEDSLPGSPDSAYSCFSSDESSPYMTQLDAAASATPDAETDNLTNLFDFIMNEELFPREPLDFIAEEDNNQLNAVPIENIMPSTYSAQQLAQHIHNFQQHQITSISQLIDTAAPYPACTSPEHLTIEKSLKAPKVRVSRRRSPRPSLSPEPSSESGSAPSSPLSADFDNHDDEAGCIRIVNTETGVSTFKCRLCPDTTFGRIHDYQRHQASKHQQNTTFTCEFCAKLFARRDALLRHYSVKSTRNDGTHPSASDADELVAARARAKLLRC